jgi:hypothetical protein
MSTKRLVDLALVVLAAILLVAGVTYWVAAAPGPPVAPDAIDLPPPSDVTEVAQLQEAVARRMSIVNGNLLYVTEILNAGEAGSWPLELEPEAAYSVDVLCAGEGFAEIQLPTGTQPALCQPDGYATSAALEGDGQAFVGVRQVEGDPLVVGIQVIRV